MNKLSFSIISLLSMITISTAQVVEYAEYIANGSRASSVNLDVIFKVTKDEKSTLYRYTTGRYSGLVEKMCTGETFPFQIRTTQNGLEDVNSIWSPMPYFEAYYELQNRNFEPGIRLVTKLDKNGIENICMEDLETCVKK